MVASIPTRMVWGIAAGFALAAFSLYAYTAAPDLTLVDSGELALAAATGGVAHPPGFPLYLLVGGAFARLPVATPARALNLMSAFWMALATGALFVATERALALVEAGGDRTRRIAAAALAAVTFFTARNPWTWSGITEVYALNVFLLASGWAAAAAALAASTPSRPAWPWVTAASAFASLGLANHHATAALLFPVLLAMSALGLPGLLRDARLWLVIAGCVTGSLALYLYLFVAAANDPGLGWGGIDSFSLLWRHVTGQQYSQQVGSIPGESAYVARRFSSLLFVGAGVPSAVLLLVGSPLAFLAVRGARRRLLLIGVPCLMVALNLALSTNYVAGPEDRMAYDLPATVAWALLVGVGAWGVLRRVPQPRVAAGAMATIALGWNVAANFDACNLRQERTARTFVVETLDQVPERSFVATSEWNFYAPFLYMRHLEGYRPDLDVVDLLMLRRFWYPDYLKRMMPETIEASRREFEVYREQATRFDLGLPYDAAAIQGLYDALLHRWVGLGLERGGAFVDWASLERPQEVSWIRVLPAVPHGLMLRFAPPGFEPLREPEPISPKDAAHLAHVRSKLTERTIRGDLTDLVPRHDPYRKVWNAYQKSVHGSLVHAIGRGGAAASDPLVAEYEKWYPETGLALETVRRRGWP